MTTDVAKRIAALVSANTVLGRMTAAPPGVPENRVSALREAYKNTLDDPDLRAGAMLLLARNAGEEFTQRLTALFGSRDPRRLGMAAQLAVRLEGRAGRARAKVLLDHPDELVRFEAITALALEGGPSGRQLVSAHFEVEKSQHLRELALRLGGDGS